MSRLVAATALALALALGISTQPAGAMDNPGKWAVRGNLEEDDPRWDCRIDSTQRRCGHDSLVAVEARS